jgi:hypothetical protein
MLRWAISLAFNRLLVLLVLVILARSYISANFPSAGAFEDWIARSSPFDEIGRAMR